MDGKNKKRIALLLGIAAMAVFLAFGALTFFGPDTAQADHGNGLPDGAKRVYSFNMIGYPEGKAYTGDCGEGHRIFVNRNANHAHVYVTHTGTWEITDCNGTTSADADGANLSAGTIGTFDMYVRLVGKPETGAAGVNTLRICTVLATDHVTGDQFCGIGEVTLRREAGRSRFALKTSELFDDAGADVIWKTYTSPDFRIAQFVVVSRP